MTNNVVSQDEIIEMARQAGMYGLVEGGLIKEFEAFAKLVDAKATAKEREACAKVCESLFDPQDDTCDEAEQCAEDIRARGETTLRGEA